MKEKENINGSNSSDLIFFLHKLFLKSLIQIQLKESREKPKEKKYSTEKNCAWLNGKYFNGRRWKVRGNGDEKTNRGKCKIRVLWSIRRIILVLAAIFISFVTSYKSGIGWAYLREHINKSILYFILLRSSTALRDIVH